MKNSLFKAKLLGLVLMWGFSLSVFAQEHELTGQVLDAGNSSPVPGVSVVVKGTSNGTITDLDGNFKLSVASNDTIAFSSVGFITQNIFAGSFNSLKVMLEPQNEAIGEVVVIGYGQVRKKDLTGAVTTIGSKEFAKGSITNAEQLIANKIPGVQVIPSSGKPGAGSSFLIRGGASLNASNDPLVVIDGVPIEGQGDGTGFLSQLNPNDIESFTVLKDASASAIYGSRASNGVILITTNKGVAGKLKISASTKSSMATIYKKIPVLNAGEFKDVAKLAADYTGITYESLALGNSETDWQDEIFRQAFTTDNSITFSGGIKKLPYRLSVGYLNQDGILLTSNYERITTMLNINPTFFDDHLKVNFNMKGSIENDQIADSRAISSAITFDPTQPVRTETSNFGGYFEYEQYASNPANLHGHYNPVGMLEQVDNHKNTYRNIGNIQLDYKLHFLPDLHLNINTGYDFSNSKTSYFMPETAFEQNIAGGSIYNADPYQEIRNMYFEAFANYVKDLKSIDSRVDAMVGYSYNDFLTTIHYYESYNAAGELQPNTTPTYAFNKPQHTLISFYARANYYFKDRYLLTATLRDDGSSRFSENNRWGLFPSVAFAWKINQEGFMKNAKILSDLKLRIGYGVTGQQDGIGNYDYIPTYSQGSQTEQYLIGNTFYTRSFPSAADRNRKWEQTATSNIGMDFGFYENRISGTIDGYIKKTTDLLNTVNVPLGTDFTGSITKNIGSMENRGVEFTLKAQPIKTKDLTWDLGFNIAYNVNEITNLSMVADSAVGLVSGSYLVNTVGYSRNVFYLYHQVYDKDGSPIEESMLDMNNDGLINDKDRYRSHSSIPKYLIGFNTNLRYKNFTAGFSCHSNLGHYMYFRPNDNLVAVYGWNVPNNLNTMYYKTEFKSSTNQSQQYSDYYLQNASFLKIDNINVGYEFENLFKSFSGNAALRINASVQNALIITKYSGQDPEASWNWGVDYGTSYPVPRTYTLGLALDF